MKKSMIQRKHKASRPEKLVSYLNELQIMRTEPFRMILKRILVRKSGDLPEEGPSDGRMTRRPVFEFKNV